jgi:Xaa-Pro aminopeptidase
MIAAIAEARIPRAKPANSSIPAIQRCLCPQSITKTFFGAAEASLRPGTPVSRIDDAIRAALRAAGRYETTMGHQSGHRIGLLSWEAPWIGPDAPGTLAEGMTMAIEPGLYLPDWGGMRLEGNYLVTASGFERLDRFPSVLVATDD